MVLVLVYASTRQGTIRNPRHLSRGYMDTISAPALHKLTKVSERTGLSRSSLYRVIRSGDLKTVKIGRAIRVREQDLADFINAFPNS